MSQWTSSSTWTRSCVSELRTHRYVFLFTLHNHVSVSNNLANLKKIIIRHPHNFSLKTRPELLCCIYCKTLYFHCILISRFWNVDISLHFNLAFSQCSTTIYQAFDGQTEFSPTPVFNFAILSYSRNSRKFDARKKYVLQ